MPTGAGLGLLCLWLWPDSGALKFRPTRCGRRRRIGALYALGASVLTLAALQFGGWSLWLLWPALSLALVALNYLAFGADGFQKRADGSMPLATRMLLSPYLLGARLNAWLWTGSDRLSEIGDNVWLGGLPRRSTADAPMFAAIIDLCAELPVSPHPGRHLIFPALDLIPLSTADLQRVVAAIEAARAEGPVLVACALGYGRSAAAVAAWLVATGRAPSPDAAIQRLRAIRPRIALEARSFS